MSGRALELDADATGAEADDIGSGAPEPEAGEGGDGINGGVGGDERGIEQAVGVTRKGAGVDA